MPSHERSHAAVHARPLFLPCLQIMALQELSSRKHDKAFITWLKVHQDTSSIEPAPKSKLRMSSTKLAPPVER
eukprot:6043860-Prymnesium_polylepis.1